eukprot:11660496-Alexandrium_andersonii.AAC.1
MLQPQQGQRARQSSLWLASSESRRPLRAYRFVEGVVHSAAPPALGTEIGGHDVRKFQFRKRPLGTMA